MKDDKPFKVGDVVVLKSGGPKMTVMDLGSAMVYSVECCWFDQLEYGWSAPSREFFTPESLTKVE